MKFDICDPWQINVHQFVEQVWSRAVFLQLIHLTDLKSRVYILRTPAYFNMKVAELLS